MSNTSRNEHNDVGLNHANFLRTLNQKWTSVTHKQLCWKEARVSW